MRKPNQHNDEMQKLSETGWSQMRELLLEKGLVNENPGKLPSSHKKKLAVLILTLAAFVLMISHPFKLNDQHPSITQQLNTSSLLLQPLSPPTKEDPGPSGSKVPQEKNRYTLVNEQKQQQQQLQLQQLLLHEKIKAQYSENKALPTLQQRQHLRDLLLQKLILEKSFSTTIPSTDQWMDTTFHINRPTTLVPKPSKSSFSRKIGIYAGAGLNISTSNSFSQLFSIKNLNVHPGITFTLPLSQKWSLHTGIWALSTIHGKGIINKEKELVNSLNSNTYYYLNTTNLIKTSYFDLPLTLHYGIGKNWTVGAGLQLSKLYKVNISEEKESYDYNNNRYATTVQQYASTPFGSIPTFPKKIDIKKFETRLALETSFQKNRFLFSGGYYYGLGKPITFKDADNSSYHYRNQYLKVSILYRVNRPR